MELEEHKTSENMKVFFTKLLELKAFVTLANQKCEEDANYGHDYGPGIISAIYEDLDAIIKEKQ